MDYYSDYLRDRPLELLLDLDNWLAQNQQNLFPHIVPADIHLSYLIPVVRDFEAL